MGIKLEEHPTLKAIRESDEQRPLVRLRGFVGKAGSEKLVRVHPSLESVQRFVDVPRDAIVASNTEEGSNGAFTFLVRADAPITVTRQTDAWRLARLQGMQEQARAKGAAGHKTGGGDCSCGGSAAKPSGGEVARQKMWGDCWPDGGGWFCYFCDDYGCDAWN